MRVETKLAKKQYVFNKHSETYLMIELEAPKVEWEKSRAPICLIPILDISSSMYGDKIDYVRKACRKLIDNLAPGDFAGIVAYNSQVHEIAEVREMTQIHKDDLKNRVAKITPSGCTNLSGGLACGLNWVNNMKLNKDVILRVVLFTDGLANIGTTGRELLDFSKELQGNASISTFGFGNDCDQELLADISNKCGGNFAFVDSPDAALSAFARELGGLMSTYAQDIKVRISPDKNNEILEVLNDEDVSEDGDEVVVHLRDILGEEKKWIIAKVLINEVDKILPRKFNAFRVNVEYKDKEYNQKAADELSVKVEFCKPGEEPMNEDSSVVRQRDMLLAAKAQDMAESMARIGDFAGAQDVMYRCFDSISDVDVKNVVGDVSSTYTNSSAYRRKKGMSNSVRTHLKGKRMSHSSDHSKSLCNSVGGQSYAAMDAMELKFTTKDDTTDTTNSNVSDEDEAAITTHTQESKTTKTKSRNREDW